MDDFEDFFSAEALQLWANDSVSSATSSQTTEPTPTGDNVAVNLAPQQPNHISDSHTWCSDPTHQPREPILVNDILDPDPSTQTQRKRKRRKSSEGIPGCLTIKPSEARGPKLKRSRFQPGRKKEVAKNRRIGACLRCRQLKISCSEIWPCPPCRRSKSSCCGRAPKFRWMDSVSCSFNEIDIYAIDSGCTPEQLARKFINGKTIDFGDVQLAFESEVLWDLDAMVSEFADWMSQKHALPASTSRVGILSSAKFTQLVRPIANEDLTRTFRLLVESSSVLYNYDGQLDIYWKDYYKDDLESIRSFAGTSVLRHLERVLSNIALAETPLKEMKALFLILCGTIIAVGYSRPVEHNQGRPESSGQSYGEAQQQLLRILAHHMVQIAERTSILDQEADKIFLIERANSLWDRQANFEWDLVDVSSCNSSIVSDIDPIDEEGNGSGFKSSTWEDDIAKVSTEPDPLSTLQQPPYAQQFYAYQPDQILNPSSTTRHWYDGPLNAGPEALSDPCSQDPLAHATHKLQHAQASLDIPAPSVHSASDRNVQLHASQSKVKDRGLYLPCLDCGATAMWPDGLVCLDCALRSGPIKNLFDASHTTSIPEDYIEPTSGVAVPENTSALCYRDELSDIQLVRTDETPEDSERDSVKWVCPLYCDLLPPEPFLPRSHHQYDGDKAEITGTCVRKRKNPLV